MTKRVHRSVARAWYLGGTLVALGLMNEVAVALLGPSLMYVTLRAIVVPGGTL